ncbi:hypothetical protein MPRS_12920 [Mycobacterium paraseoulense]|nr:hypothetical protein MPRS_12920 [Mycobacterium paraseoulense]
MLADVVDHHDVPTRQPRGRARLRVEPQAAVRPVGHSRIEEFDSDGPVQLPIPTVTHLGHRTLAQDPAQFVPTVAKAPARHHKHSVTALAAVRLSSWEVRVDLLSES